MVWWKWAIIGVIAVVYIVVEVLFRCQRCGSLHGGYFCFRRPPGGWDEF
jgi:hypothetical protein